MKNFFIIELGKNNPNKKSPAYYGGKGKYANSFGITSKKSDAKMFYTEAAALKEICSNDFQYRLVGANRFHTEIGWLEFNPIVVEYNPREI